MGASQAWKRIPRIKFPQRNFQAPPSGSGFQNKAASTEGDANITFFSGSQVSKPLGGKASDQPKRTPVSCEEIEAIMMVDAKYVGIRRNRGDGYCFCRVDVLLLCGASVYWKSEA